MKSQPFFFGMSAAERARVRRRRKREAQRGERQRREVDPRQLNLFDDFSTNADTGTNDERTSR